jgi:phosphopentomutase
MKVSQFNEKGKKTIGDIVGMISELTLTKISKLTLTKIHKRVEMIELLLSDSNFLWARP